MRLLQGGHSGPVRAVAYSPDGRWLASGGQDHFIQLWQLPGILTQRPLLGHADWIRGLAFSPDGTRLASVAWDCTMYLWSLAQRKHIDYTFGHHGGAWSVAYCPSGDFIASGAGDGTINFTRKSGKVPLSRKQHTAPVTGLTYTHDGRHLLSVSHDRTVKCWDAQWCVFRTQLQTHPSWVCCGDVSPDGQLVVAGNDVGGLIASTLNDPTEVWQLQAHGSPVYGVRFLPDGQSLLTIGWDGTARMWEAHTGRERMAYDWGVGKMYCLAISPDGMTAAAGGENGTIVMWDLEE